MTSARTVILFVLTLVAAASMVACSSCAEEQSPAPERYEVPLVAGTAGLRGPADFEHIADGRARSQALFLEASRVMLHPRCVNCHPSGDAPRQGDDSHAHVPPVARATPAMYCFSCHQDANVEAANVPGAPHWDLAPATMAWEARTPRQLCAQLKDPAENGHRDLEELVELSATNELIAWGWHPGASRVPAPGSQALFASLLRAWIDSGAVCPEANRTIEER